MPSDAFTLAAEKPPHGGFGLVLGKMLREFGDMSADDYNLVGQVQARTIILAELSNSGTPEQRAAIIAKFGGSRDKQPTGKLDMNGAMFGLKKDTAVAQLDEFIAGLNVDGEKLSKLTEQANLDVHKEDGVRADAAASAVIIKSLIFADKNRDQKQAIVDASLIMQLGTRAMERLSAMEKGNYNQQAALDLMNKSNKLNYKFDPPALRKTNQALFFFTTVEQAVDTALQEATDKEAALLTQKQAYEGALPIHIKAIIDAMPEAARLYRSAGKEALAQNAEEVHEFFANRYELVTQQPFLAARAAPEAPKPPAQ